jgi:hypothetical protein
MRGRTPGSLMNWCRGQSCRWLDILFGFAAGAELPPDVARQQVDSEQVIDVDQTAVAIETCQVGVGHLGWVQPVWLHAGILISTTYCC